MLVKREYFTISLCVHETVDLESQLSMYALVEIEPISYFSGTK